MEVEQDFGRFQEKTTQSRLSILVNDMTLFQDTILRLPEDFSDPIIVYNEEHRFIAVVVKTTKIRL